MCNIDQYAILWSLINYMPYYDPLLDLAAYIQNLAFPMQTLGGINNMQMLDFAAGEGMPQEPNDKSQSSLISSDANPASNDSKKNKGKEHDSLLENHPHKITYHLNKKTNRKLKRMVCTFENCGKVFEKKWNFKDHIRMHNGETPYSCNECGKSFTQRGNLVKHERQHRFKSLKSRKIHQCKVCSKAFTEKYNLKVRD